VFSDNQLTSVSIPNNVRLIGNYAFYNNQLKGITISKNVNYIGENVFRLSNLNEIIILGNETRFNDLWEEIGFPASLMSTE
jgi:hypothetical protein